MRSGLLAILTAAALQGSASLRLQHAVQTVQTNLPPKLKGQICRHGGDRHTGGGARPPLRLRGGGGASATSASAAELARARLMLLVANAGFGSYSVLLRAVAAVPGAEPLGTLFITFVRYSFLCLFATATRSLRAVQAPTARMQARPTASSQSFPGLRRGAAWPMVAPPRWRRRRLAPASRRWSWAPTLCRAPSSPSGALAASPPRCPRSLRRRLAPRLGVVAAAGAALEVSRESHRTTCFARSSRSCSAWVASGGAPGAPACSPLAPRPSRRPSTTREAAEAKEEAAACRVPWLLWRRLGWTPSTASAPPSTCAPTPPRRAREAEMGGDTGGAGHDLPPPRPPSLRPRTSGALSAGIFAADVAAGGASAATLRRHPATRAARQRLEARSRDSSLDTDPQDRARAAGAVGADGRRRLRQRLPLGVAPVRGVSRCYHHWSRAVVLLLLLRRFEARAPLSPPALFPDSHPPPHHPPTAHLAPLAHPHSLAMCTSPTSPPDLPMSPHTSLRPCAPSPPQSRSPSPRCSRSSPACSASRC